MFLRLATETGKTARRRGLFLIFGGLLLSLAGPFAILLVSVILGLPDGEYLDAVAGFVSIAGLAIYVIGNFAYASAKGYVGWMWAVLSFLLIGPLILLLLPDKVAE